MACPSSAPGEPLLRLQDASAPHRGLRLGGRVSAVLYLLAGAGVAALLGIFHFASNKFGSNLTAEEDPVTMATHMATSPWARNGRIMAAPHGPGAQHQLGARSAGQYKPSPSLFRGSRPQEQIPHVISRAQRAPDTLRAEGMETVRGGDSMISGKRAATKICVFGSGRFGTALATVIARKGYTVMLLTRREEVAESINTSHVNPLMASYELPPTLSATTDAATAINGAEYIVHSIPVQSTPEFLEPLKDLIPVDVPFLSTSKGLKTDTLETMNELVPRVLGRKQPMAFLSGPTFAQELMEGYPSGLVIASDNETVSRRVRVVLNSPQLRCYTSDDVIGVELGGALKNVYALAAGAAEGMGFSSNTVSFIVTRACAEMNMVAVAMGAKSHTMAGLSGIGDLMLTCMGGLSRNKAVGMRLGKGEALSSVLQARGLTLSGVAEGVATTPAAAKLAKKFGVEAPIINVVASVLEGKRETKDALRVLMTGKEFKTDFSGAASVMEKKLQLENELKQVQATMRVPS